MTDRGSTMRRWLAGLVLATTFVGGAASARAAQPESVLFVGNSFTFAAYSPVWRYRASSVTDLNGSGVGGVPALFKLFSEEAGLSYQVSLVTNPGIGLDYHWAHNLAKIDRPWDHVLLQTYSTLDAAKPGDPTLLADYAGRFVRVLRAQNPKVDIRLTATWSRADLTYLPGKPWSGKPIFAMADDLERAEEAAAHATPGVTGVIPVGEAFNDAIREGVADPNPYDGIAFDQVDLWAHDHYHASAFGYYLEALVIFGAVTGHDPESLGARETAAAELGFSAKQTLALQHVAHEELARQHSSRPLP